MRLIQLLVSIVWLLVFSMTQATDLVLNPTTPTVEINKTIVLSVQGAVGKVEWTVGKGKIQGEGNQVIYVAPEQTGFVVVTVLDSEGNYAAVRVVITPPSDFSLENAQWDKIFTSRDIIQALLLSEDGKTLWVGTNGGLEKWDTETTELKRVFTESDGLPNSDITDIVNDNNGLWIIAGGYSEPINLSHLSYEGKLLFSYKLPLNTTITSIINDDKGGVWVGTLDGLIHIHLDGNYKSTVYRTSNSEIPDNSINSLIKDGLSGLWVGTSKGLVHIDSNYRWITYNTSNSNIPENSISTLAKDEANGLWIGTANNFLAYFDGKTWTVTHSEYPIIRIISDRQEDLWLLFPYDDSQYVGVLGHYRNREWAFSKELNLEEPNIIKNVWEDTDRIISDGNGGIWIGTGSIHFSPGSYMGEYVESGRLIHVDSQNKTSFFENPYGVVFDNPYGVSDTSYLVYDIVNDHHTDGVWVSFKTSGWFGTELAYKSLNGDWKIANRNSLYLPSNYLTSLANDGENGLWIGMGNGERCSSGDGDAACNYGFLAHVDNHNEWKIFNDANSNLPNNNVIQIFSDEDRGAWIATGADAEGSGNFLAHIDNNWDIITVESFSCDDSESFRILSSDRKGGIWITQDMGDLVHVTADGVPTTLWNDYCFHDEDFLYQSADFINGDGSGGIWIKVSDYVDDFSSEIVNESIVHLDNNGEVIETFDSDYELPHAEEKELWSIADDGESLIYLGKEDKKMIFKLSELKIPGDIINFALPTGNDGLWVSTDKSLAHLTFGRPTELCTQAEIDSATCQAIQEGQHAAIIVAAGGAQDTNTLWESTEAITTRLYRTFYRRGFDKSHIYYLSPKTWADFNGDGYNDHIDRIKEDRNLTFDDLQAAFTWAKGLGKLDQPLYFFFMDHGGEGKLQLSPDLNITAEQLKTLLDDYQTTGNSLIAVIEACYSGSLIPTLAAPNRAVIASAKDNEVAYFFEKKGFSRFLADYLLAGASFAESFTLAGRDQEKLLGKNLNLQTAGGTGLTISQTPQVDDNQDGTFTTADGQWLKTVYINGQFTTADATLTVINQTPATTLTVGQALTLQAKATLTQGTVKRVWAVIRPPAIAQILDTSGTPILAFPRLNLGRSPENPEIWQATWNDAVYNGKYLITFYAEDNEKNIASSEQDTVLTVTGGIDPPNTAQVQIHLEKDRYQRGEPFKATLTEELGWGYDLYAAVLFPDGQNFMTLKNTNELRPLNEAKPWYAARKQHQAVTLFDLTLPADLPTGQYCLFGILSPEQNDVFETLEKGLWVMDSKCFEVF